MAVQAAVTYAVNEMVGVNYRSLAVQANELALVPAGTGLPAGPYHPEFGADKVRYAP